MLPLFLIVVIDLLGFGIVIPLLPFYGEHYGASPAVVGLLMATFSLGQFVMAPVWGRLSDRIGRRPVLLSSLAGSVLAYLWLAFAHSLWALFAARALAGLMAGNISAAFAYVADVTTRETRSKGMGMIGAAFGLGFIIGPAVGGFLAGHDPANIDAESPALAAAGLSLVAFVVAVAVLKESLSPEVRARIAGQPRVGRWQAFLAAMGRPTIGWLLAATFLSTFVFAGMEATFALWSERAYGWGATQNGYLFAFIGMTTATIQGGLMGKLAKRFGESNLLVQGAIALTIGIAAIPFALWLPGLVVTMGVVAYGFALSNTSLVSLISLQAGEHEQGGVLGVSRSMTTLGRVLGPAWAGLLFDVFGRDWPYFAGATVMLAVLALALAVRRRLRT
jgi:DHA1 family tetracycline resistance protein-like MFS transporter